MKTIKQIAEELGVSKTAVRKKIENLGLHSGLRKNGNQFVIDEKQEKLIKSAFFEEKDKKTETKSETSSRTETETVFDLVSVLEKELSAKNEQIAHLQKLLDQEQQLRMISEQKLLQIEENKTVEESPKKKKWQFWK